MSRVEAAKEQFRSWSPPEPVDIPYKEDVWTALMFRFVNRPPLAVIVRTVQMLEQVYQHPRWFERWSDERLVDVGTVEYRLSNANIRALAVADAVFRMAHMLVTKMPPPVAVGGLAKMIYPDFTQVNTVIFLYHRLAEAIPSWPMVAYDLFALCNLVLQRVMSDSERRKKVQMLCVYVAGWRFINAGQPLSQCNPWDLAVGLVRAVVTNSKARAALQELGATPLSEAAMQNLRSIAEPMEKQERDWAATQAATALEHIRRAQAAVQQLAPADTGAVEAEVEAEVAADVAAEAPLLGAGGATEDAWLKRHETDAKWETLFGAVGFVASKGRMGVPMTGMALGPHRKFVTVMQRPAVKAERTIADTGALRNLLIESMFSTSACRESVVQPTLVKWSIDVRLPAPVKGTPSGRPSTIRAGNPPPGQQTSVQSGALRPNPGRIISASKFVNGTLEEFVRDKLKNKQAIDPTTALRMGKQLLGALMCAHALSIVHNDVQPKNVWVHSTPQGVECRLAGWDHAALQLDSATSERTLPVEESEWMSPEALVMPQFHGMTSDVWAVNLMVAWMMGVPGVRVSSTEEPLLMWVAPAKERTTPRMRRFVHWLRILGIPSELQWRQSIGFDIPFGQVGSAIVQMGRLPDEEWITYVRGKETRREAQAQARRAKRVTSAAASAAEAVAAEIEEPAAGAAAAASDDPFSIVYAGGDPILEEGEVVDGVTSEEGVSTEEEGVLVAAEEEEEEKAEPVNADALHEAFRNSFPLHLEPVREWFESMFTFTPVQRGVGNALRAYDMTLQTLRTAAPVVVGRQVVKPDEGRELRITSTSETWMVQRGRDRIAGNFRALTTVELNNFFPKLHDELQGCSEDERTALIELQSQVLHLHTIDLPTAILTDMCLHAIKTLPICAIITSVQAEIPGWETMHGLRVFQGMVRPLWFSTLMACDCAGLTLNQPVVEVMHAMEGRLVERSRAARPLDSEQYTVFSLDVPMTVYVIPPLFRAISQQVNNTIKAGEVEVPVWFVRNDVWGVFPRFKLLTLLTAMLEPVSPSRQTSLARPVTLPKYEVENRELLAAAARVTGPVREDPIESISWEELRRRIASGTLTTVQVAEMKQLFPHHAIQLERAGFSIQLTNRGDKVCSFDVTNSILRRAAFTSDCIDKIPMLLALSNAMLGARTFVVVERWTMEGSIKTPLAPFVRRIGAAISDDAALAMQGWLSWLHEGRFQNVGNLVKHKFQYFTVTGREWRLIRGAPPASLMDVSNVGTWVADWMYWTSNALSMRSSAMSMLARYSGDETPTAKWVEAEAAVALQVAEMQASQARRVAEEAAAVRREERALLARIFAEVEAERTVDQEELFFNVHDDPLTENGYIWLTTTDGNEWRTTPAGRMWLEGPVGRRFMARREREVREERILQRQRLGLHETPEVREMRMRKETMDRLREERETNLLLQKEREAQRRAFNAHLDDKERAMRVAEEQRLARLAEDRRVIAQRAEQMERQNALIAQERLAFQQALVAHRQQLQDAAQA